MTKPLEIKPGLFRKEYIVGGLAMLLTISLCILAVFYWNYVRNLAQYGYLGVFIISILSGGTVVVPVPGLLVIFTLGGVLQPAIVGAIAGLGEAIGSIGIYLTGYGGESAFRNTGYTLYTKFADWVRHRGSVAVFLMSAVFNPLFYPFTAIAGTLHFGLIRFFLLCWAGKTVKGMTVAYAGYFGLGSILRWLGIVI